MLAYKMESKGIVIFLIKSMYTLKTQKSRFATNTKAEFIKMSILPT
jgi:hypothetical protein